MSKVWLITGASRGLSRNIAEAGTTWSPPRAYRNGFMNWWNVTGAESVPGSRIVRDPSAAETAVQTAVDAFGRIDVVVGAARSAEPAVENFEVDTFRVPVETNLFGFIYLTPAASPILRQLGHGHVIQIVRSEAGQYVTSAVHALGGFEANWRN